ncbi:hypothetical protein ACFW2Y_00860 [Streptomyces sp. NPDC058877]|uniref:hypothetical protein n=1 Tax=Streptomyces sp. NPDC058877 TaxID=3346665 RepID=UPI003697522D
MSPIDRGTLIRQLADSAGAAKGPRAATWLLVQHGFWLPELLRAEIITTLPSGIAFISWQSAANHCSGPGSRPGASIPRPLDASDSQWAILKLACVLTGYHALDLYRLGSLDDRNRALATYAFAWATGGQQYAASTGLVTGLCPRCSWRPENCPCSDAEASEVKQ